jgi:hypothetical protein
MNKFLYLIILITAVGISNSFSQPLSEKGNLLLIREDVVRPSMAETYELGLLDMAGFLKENNEEKVNYLTHIQDNFHYTHISSINDLNDIEKVSLEKYISGEKASDDFSFFWEIMNGTLDTRHSYVVEYDAKNSYVPEGESWLEGMPYRKWNYYYFSPGTEEEVEKILSAWKYLYQQNNIESGYRVYRGVLGIEQPVVLFTSWAKNPLEHHQNLEANTRILGEEGSALLIGILESATKVETIEGYFVPEFSYQPE